MRLPILLAAALLLAACAPPGEFDDARVEALAAFEAGDTRRALRVLRAAASQGDLSALHTLAHGHTSGAVQFHGREARHFAVPTYPWSAARWRRAYRDEIARRVDAGDPEAILFRADELLNAHLRIDRGTVTREDSTEAFRMLTALAEAGNTHAMLRMGFGQIGRDREEAARWFRRATQAGDPQACWFTLYYIDRVQPHAQDAARLAVALERGEECAALEPARQPGADHDFSASLVSGLAEQAGHGNREAITLLDSLATLGVFDRHPRLAAIAAGP